MNELPAPYNGRRLPLSKDFREEEDVYDKLAISVSGDLLTDIYLQSRKSLQIEQAGGAATTGTQRVMDIETQQIHERAPMIFGSIHEVELVEKYYAGLNPSHERPQLFKNRTLLRNWSQEKSMSVKHPIISVTGSSGAGTTSVKQTFDSLVSEFKEAIASKS